MVAGVVAIPVFVLYVVSWVATAFYNWAVRPFQRARCEGCGHKGAPVRMITARRPKGIPLCRQCAGSPRAVLAALAIWGDRHPDRVGWTVPLNPHTPRPGGMNSPQAGGHRLPRRPG